MLIVLSDNALTLWVIQQLLAADYPLVAVQVAQHEDVASSSVGLLDLAAIAMVIVAAIEPETEPLALLGRSAWAVSSGRSPSC